MIAHSRLTTRLLAVTLILTTLLATGCGGTHSRTTDTTSPAPSSATALPPPAQGPTPAHRSGQPFQAKPDFAKAGATCSARPCYLPTYSQPKLDEVYVIKALTGYPCEYYDAATSSSTAPYCVDHTSLQGDVVTVTCQVRGDSVSNADGKKSSVWDGITSDKIRAQVRNGIALAPDMWLGNAGSNGLHPCWLGAA